MIYNLGGYKVKDWIIFGLRFQVVFTCYDATFQWTIPEITEPWTSFDGRKVETLDLEAAKQFKSMWGTYAVRSGKRTSVKHSLRS